MKVLRWLDQYLAGGVDQCRLFSLTLQYPGLETTVNMALPQNSREGIIQKTSLVLSVFYPFKKELMENCSKCSMIGIKERASESHQTSG